MRILLFADIHIGAIKEIPYVYNVITDIIEKEVLLKRTDMVVILGDYFDKLFKANEDNISLAINVMSYLIRSCAKNGTKIRILYGTESHEMNQYKIFNYHITSSDIDLRIFDTVTEEEIEGKKILYIPEEYINDKKKYYKDFLYSDKTYDYIFGHGIIEDGMPSIVSSSHESNKNNEKHVPRFKSGELSAVSNICVFGHYHCYTDMGNNVYYLGSLFRYKFGEEIDKGYGIIEDDKFNFIKNEEAYIYKTYEFDDLSSVYDNYDTSMKCIKDIKEENKDIFEGKIFGRIKIKFKLPRDIDPSFKENLKNILFNDKNITTSIDESNCDEVLSELKDEIDDGLEYILDASFPILDTIHTFINKEYDYPMPLKKLESYIGKLI